MMQKKEAPNKDTWRNPVKEASYNKITILKID